MAASRFPYSSSALAELLTPRTKVCLLHKVLPRGDMLRLRSCDKRSGPTPLPALQDTPYLPGCHHTCSPRSSLLGPAWLGGCCPPLLGPTQGSAPPSHPPRPTGLPLRGWLVLPSSELPLHHQAAPPPGPNCRAIPPASSLPPQHSSLLPSYNWWSAAAKARRAGGSAAAMALLAG